MFISEKEELVYIFSPKENLFDSFYLMGIDGKHPSNDCRINLDLDSMNNLKILDIISNTPQRGYAKILLKYTIQKAIKNGVQEIYGDLSYVDRDEFGWLIPFYESLGFECTLFDTDKAICGRIKKKLHQ